jgi:cell wall-associated NlpC family hydrolase
MLVRLALAAALIAAIALFATQVVLPDAPDAGDRSAVSPARSAADARPADAGQAAERSAPIEPTDEPEASEAAAAEVATEAASPMRGLTVTRADDPARSMVEDADGNWVATFTDGAYTVTLAGPARDFNEPTATHGVTTDRWVRILDEPFDGEVDGEWLAAARADGSPDVLAVATEYFEGAPDVVDDDGVLISAAAEYGPLQPDGSRPVGSDWHDFRGVDVTYGDILDEADPEEYGSLDCSGYVRIVYGFRFGIPMSLRPDNGTTLPRRSFEQAADAPGVTPIPDRGRRPSDLDALEAGDLVFFDDPGDGDDRIDHVGIYLGIDDGGNHRFIHSRRSHNGPTMGGDDTGVSVIDGDGFYARGFRATRRL